MNAHEYAVYLAGDLCDLHRATSKSNRDALAAVVSAIEERLVDENGSVSEAYHAGLVEARRRKIARSR